MLGRVNLQKCGEFESPQPAGAQTGWVRMPAGEALRGHGGRAVVLARWDLLDQPSAAFIYSLRFRLQGYRWHDNSHRPRCPQETAGKGGDLKAGSLFVK